MTDTLENKVDRALAIFEDYIECDEYHIHDGTGEHEGDTPYEIHKDFDDVKAREEIASIVREAQVQVLELVDDNLYDINSTEWGIPTKWSKEQYNNENYADLWTPNKAIHEVVQARIKSLTNTMEEK